MHVSFTSKLRPLFYRALENQKTGSLKIGELDATAVLSVEAKQKLEWWLNIVKILKK